MGGAWGDPMLKPVSPARAIWGEYGRRQLGLPLIVDILKRHGLAATFFLTPFIAEQGYTDEAERICEFLIDCGQDVQLHIHPNHWAYGLAQKNEPHRRTDYMSELSPQERLALLQEGSERLTHWTGRPCVAFRAGNMGASEETLVQVEEAGLLIDSSYTFPYAGGQCRFRPEDPYNGSKRYGGVIELALSGFLQGRVPWDAPAKPLDLTGISFPECREAIRRICGAGADAVVILHSFSPFKVRNVRYEGGRPNRVVIRRFQALCHWLSASGEFPVHTFDRLAAAVSAGEYTPHAVPPCRLNHPRALVRKAVQAWNRFYWT